MAGGNYWTLTGSRAFRGELGLGPPWVPLGPAVGGWLFRDLDPNKELRSLSLQSHLYRLTLLAEKVIDDRSL